MSHKEKDAGVEERDFFISVLGRTLEHLGVQMYKHREPAIAELVANSWDAGATRVEIIIPVEDAYDKDASTISIKDDGCGMTADNVQDKYLIVGRNRRVKDEDPPPGRPVMGKKGIGKLAGFGIATQMAIRTVRDGKITEFTMDSGLLKAEDGESGKVPIKGAISSVSGVSAGTEVVLKSLKHLTAIKIDSLHESLARRFSRRIRGEMAILINGEALREPVLNLVSSLPTNAYAADTTIEKRFHEVTIGDGSKVRFRYGFNDGVIPTNEMKGFTIYVRGKTAQAPPFYFFVENKASGQHGTKYLTGEIEADFIDEGNEDVTDIISTDRQEIDWESEKVRALKEWGERLTRDLLVEWANRNAQKFEDYVNEDEGLKARIDKLDSSSKKQVKKYFQTLGKTESKEDEVKTLADSVLQAYEFRQFHNVLEDMDQCSEDPDKLKDLLIHLKQWRVLESRAIMEIIRGRLEIVDKMEKMIVENAPETAPKAGADNLHDLIARFPWLLDPDWNTFAEEKTLTKQLKEWGCTEIEEKDRERYDFMAITSESRTIIIEIKRSAYPVNLEDLQRLERYKDKISKARENVEMVMLCGSTAVDKDILKNWSKREDGSIRYWKSIVEPTKKRYDHYRAVLDRAINSPEFSDKENEVAQTREVLESGSVYRGKEGRAKGLGSSKA